MLITYRYKDDDTWYTTKNEKILLDSDKHIISVEYYDIDGKTYHRENGPSNIQYCILKGERYLELEEYFFHGKRHRIDGPAKIHYDKHSNITKECYYNNNKLHRTDGPAIVCYKDNKIYCFTYMVDNKIHRDDGPAYQTISTNGDIESQIYYKHGVLHRDNDEPAIIQNDGDERRLYWFINGEKMRENPELPHTIIYYDTHEEHIFANDTTEILKIEDLLVKSV